MARVKRQKQAAAFAPTERQWRTLEKTIGRGADDYLRKHVRLAIELACSEHAATRSPTERIEAQQKVARHAHELRAVLTDISNTDTLLPYKLGVLVRSRAQPLIARSQGAVPGWIARQPNEAAALQVDHLKLEATSPGNALGWLIALLKELEAVASEINAPSVRRAGRPQTKHRLDDALMHIAMALAWYQPNEAQVATFATALYAMFPDELRTKRKRDGGGSHDRKPAQISASLMTAIRDNAKSEFSALDAALVRDYPEHTFGEAIIRFNDWRANNSRKKGN